MPNEKHEDAPRSDSRRRFTKTLVAAVVAGAAASADAQTPPAAKEPKAPPNPQPTPAQQPQQPPKPTPLGVAYAEVARVRFGENGQIVLPQTVVQIQDDKVVEIFTDRFVNQPVYPVPGWDKRRSGTLTLQN